MPLEDAFSHLSADTAHRFRAVAEALLELGRILPDRPRLLDVGGYPGSFAREFTGAWPRWTAMTLDRPEEELPDYVAGGGEELPFEDAAFDAVVSIDTFEHIPPANRRAFLAELCRVSASAVVLACPVHHGATCSIEKLYNQAHQAAFGAPHPWLHEHVEFGLPRVAEVFADWPESHGIIDAAGSYDLRAWSTWHGLWLVRRLRGELDNVWQGFDQAIAASPVPPAIEVPYRRIFAAVRGAERGEAPIEPGDLDGQGAVELARCFARLLDIESRGQQEGGGGGGHLVVDQRLKDALVSSEKQLEALRAEIEVLKSRGRPSLLGMFRK